MSTTLNRSNIVSLLEKEFEPIDGYKSWDRTIQKTTITEDGTISLLVYRSNQSSIHYNYKINMVANINDTTVSISISTETSASRGDPYCNRGYNNTPSEYKFSEPIGKFENDAAIVKYIDRTFWKHYFQINSRN